MRSLPAPTPTLASHLTGLRPEQLLSWLVAMLPLSFALSSRFKVLPMAVLALVGLGLLIRRVDVRSTWWGARWVIIACLLRLIYDICNVASHRLGWAPLDLPSQTLPFLALAAVFALPIDRRILALGFGLTSLTLGIVCFYQHYLLGIERPYGLNGGDWAAIEFAMYLLIMVLLSLLEALRSDVTWLMRAFYSVAAAIGLAGAILTQSRGPLLAFAPICSILLIWQGWQSRHWRRALIALGLVIIGMLIVTASLQREMLERFSAVQRELATSSSLHTHGAIRERLEMWRLSWRAFTEHPLAGLGLDQFGPYVQAQASQGKASLAIAGYVHPHSEYFESLVAGGLPALLVLLAFLCLPLAFFLSHSRCSDETVRHTAAAGAMTVTMFALCGFSDNVFYRAMPHSLYLFLVLGFAVDICRRTGLKTSPIR